MANEIEIVVSATNEASQTLSEAAAAARADGEAAGVAFAEGVDAGASKLEGSGVGMDKLGASMAAEGEAAGEEAGAALTNGVVSGTSSLEDRMRAGYDKVLASWQDGTSAFVAEQLQTFADYYGKLAALGDESAAAQLAAVQALAGGTEEAVQEMSTGVMSVVDRMNADLEAALAMGGKSSGAAFVRALDGSLSDMSLSDQGVSGAFSEISAEAAAAGARAGDSFAVSFSAASMSAMTASTVTGVTSEAFSLVPQITPAEITSVAQMSTQTESLANAAAKVSNQTVPMGTSLKELTASGEESTKSFGGLAQMMNGPLMQAFWGISSLMYLPMALGQFLPMLSGLFTAGAVSASDFTQAVAQDSNAVGDNTAATIQATLAKSGLNDISKELGVSQATLIEYAAGESQAQKTVTDAYNAKESSLNSASNAEGVHSKAQVDAGNAADKEANALAGKKSALDQATNAVQEAIKEDQANSDALLAAEQSTKIYTAAVDALGSAMLLQVQQTKMTDQATVDYASKIMAAQLATGTFNVELNAARASMQINAQTTAISSVGLLGLGDNQGAVNLKLVQAEQAYTDATNSANSYNTAVMALNGSSLTLDQAQNTLAQQMLTARTSFQANSESLDINTKAGVANRTALVSAAQAIIAMGTAQYEATGDMNKANTTMQQQIDAFVKATGATGQAKTAIEQYLAQITKIPPNVSTTITADTGPADTQLQRFIERVNGSSATVTIYENSSGQVWSPSGGNRAQATGGIISAAAVGGPRDGWTMINEHGQEFARLPTGTTVIPHSNVQSLEATAARPYGISAPPLTLEIVGGDAEMVALLRKIIRVRGGNVQRVLGVN